MSYHRRVRVVGPVLGTLIVATTLSAESVTPVALPPATMEELARVAVAPVGGERRERPRPRPAVVAAENAIAAAIVVAPLGAPPPITRGFQAVTDPLPGAQYMFDPADASGAVGPQHVVGAFNNSVTVHDRSGNLVSRVTTPQFWHDPTAPDKIPYDPRVAYDALSDRWVIVMLGDDSGFVNGVLFVAISLSGNPAGGWRRFRVPIDPTGKLDPDKSHLAVTADTIVITTDVWDGAVNPVDTTIFTMPRAAAFAGPNLPISATPVGFFPSDLVPVTSRDATLRFASAFNNSIYMYVMQPNGTLNNETRYQASVASKPPVYCAQLGESSAPDCGEATVQAALNRDGATWIVQQDYPTGAVVWKITGSAATAYLIYDNALAIAYPSLAVNRWGAALIGYVVMGPSIYPSAAYSYIDPTGNISELAMLKSGEFPFKRSRWGDFTTTVVDPADDLSFWTLGVYANSPDLVTRWATWWGYVKIQPPTARHRAVRH
jgi:hypothetical protein